MHTAHLSHSILPSCSSHQSLLGPPLSFPTSLSSFHALPFISFHFYPPIPGTFVIAYSLKFFKFARFFPTRVRSLLSDFSVFIAILLMTAANVALDLDTERLHVPTEFEVCKFQECNFLGVKERDLKNVNVTSLQYCTGVLNGNRVCKKFRTGHQI